MFLIKNKKKTLQFEIEVRPRLHHILKSKKLKNYCWWSVITLFLLKTQNILSC